MFLLPQPAGAAIISSFEGHVNFSENKFDLVFNPVVSSVTSENQMREFFGHFTIKEHQLYLNSYLKEQLACHGAIDLFYPYKLNFIFNLAAIDMDDFLNFWVRDKGYHSSGMVSGEIKVLGALNRLSLKGNLQSTNGFIKELKYDSIYLNIEGIYPRLEITSSTLTKTGGLSYVFAGPFNLGAQENFKEQIKLLNISPLVKDSPSQREWTLKRLQGENSTATEIKYLLRKENETILSNTQGAQSDLLGVQRTLEF